MGVNALDYAAQLVVYINSMAQKLALNGHFDYDYKVPYITLHTGTIQGEIALNIVPSHCEFEFEIRYLAQQEPRPLVQEIIDYAHLQLQPKMHQVALSTGINIEPISGYLGSRIQLASAIGGLIPNNT